MFHYSRFERPARVNAGSKIVRPIAAAFGLIALAGVIPANAADVIGEEPPAPEAVESMPVSSWTGPYAGLQLGYGMGKTDTEGETVDTDGIIGGGFAGYNVQSGAVVYGVEGDVGYGDREGKDGGVRSKSGVEGSLRGRFGYTVTPDVLVYGTAGGAAQNLKVREGGESDKNTMLGYTVGAGADVKFTENVFGRAEYRYSDYGSEKFRTGSGSQDVNSSDHRVQFGVGMNF